MEFKLIIKKINDTLTPKEESIFTAWYNESDSNREYFQSVKDNYLKDINPETIDLHKAWKSIDKIISPNRNRRLYAYVAAASVVLLFGIAYFTRVHVTKFNQEKQNVVVTKENKSNDIVLTLADGSQVVLNEQKTGVIANQNNVIISKDKDGQIRYEDKNSSHKGKVSLNTINIPHGKTFQIELPDGTKVWLNSKSSLQYPVEFNEDKRLVTLEGEAYFEVTKNKHSPFTVKTKSGNVTVLGTHFNVNAYSEDHNFETTLVEGKVKVSDVMAAKEESVVLKPGQQARARNASLKVIEVDPSIYTAWKDGKFYFENENLKSILTKMGRWYDFNVKFEQKALEQIKFTGIVLKDEPLENLLNIISKTSNIKYKVTKVNQTYEVTISK